MQRRLRLHTPPPHPPRPNLLACAAQSRGRGCPPRCSSGRRHAPPLPALHLVWRGVAGARPTTTEQGFCGSTSGGRRRYGSNPYSASVTPGSVDAEARASYQASSAVWDSSCRSFFSQDMGTQFGGGVGRPGTPSRNLSVHRNCKNQRQIALGATVERLQNHKATWPPAHHAKPCVRIMNPPGPFETHPCAHLLCSGSMAVTQWLVLAAVLAALCSPARASEHEAALKFLASKYGAALPPLQPLR